MRVQTALTALTVLGIAVASAFALGPSAPATPSSGPQPVVVTNTTPVPVTGTVNLGGSITSTITGTPSVTVANTNPIPVSQVANRPPMFYASVVGVTVRDPQLVTVTYPTGYTRLVIDKAMYQIYSVPQDLVEPAVVVSNVSNLTTQAQILTQDVLPVPVGQSVNGGTQFFYQSEATGLGTVVDSGNFLYVLNSGVLSAGDTNGFALVGHFEP